MQTALFVPRIAALGHEILVSSPYNFGGNPLAWNDFTVLPAVRDPQGNDVLALHYDYFKADLLISLCDLFGLMKCAKRLNGLNFVPWTPVDVSPVGEGDIQVLRDAGVRTPIAMSRFGERCLMDEGLEPYFIPHGVDTEIFSPGDPDTFRETIPGKIGPDTFIIGLAAMNRDVLRKGIPEQMQAFANFHRRHPDSLLALHTAPVNNPGLNLMGMAARLGISEAISFPDSYSYDTGIITREQLATWYRGLDVLSLCSYGEGFGLPLIEAQACGIPVITTSGSAMHELCGAGWVVSGSPFWASGHGAWWTRPDVADIMEAYEAAWQAREEGTLPKKEARDFAMLYDADRILELFWKPVLADIEARIDEMPQAA